MSNDLISRSALIETIDDYLGVQKYLLSENIREIIENFPTAYDVDKVVKLLDKGFDCKGTYTCFTGGCKECANQRAIDIVRKGGID